MKRSLLAFFTGFVVWVVVVTLLNFGLRAAIPGYTAAEPTMSFTLPMMVGRLTIAAITSLVAGAVVGFIAPATRTPWVLGVVLVAAFLPEHVRIWSKFPVWYHLTFLVTLLPLIVLGSRLPRSSSPTPVTAPGIDRAAVNP
jgi:hypothetical protein